MSINKEIWQRWARTYAASFAIWLCLSTVMATQNYMNAAAYSENRMPYTSFLKLVVIRHIALSIITPPIFLLVRRWPINSRRPILKTTCYLALFAAFVTSFATVRWLIWPPYDPVHRVWVARTAQSFRGLFFSPFDLIFLYLGLVGVSHAFEFYRRERLREVEQSDLRRALAEHELQLLKTQIHPHFLFNTLQGIATLICDEPVKAKDLVISLGELLRAALRHDSSDLIPLREEMVFIQKYLELEKMRLSERLQVRCSIDESSYQYLVPQMILQPLVENAITHGASASRSGGWLEICTSVETDEDLKIVIRNSVGKNNTPGTGLGLSNVRSRLRHLYTTDSSVTFAMQTSNTAEVVLRIPKLTGATQ